MNFITLGNILLPIVVLIVIVVSLYKNVPLYDVFVEGAKEGIKLGFQVFPCLLGMIFGINILLKSNLIADFLGLLKLPSSDKITINILEKTNTGRIKKVKINGKDYTGKEVASLLKLKSNCFTITENGNKVTIKTKGYGHGVGMSQYGAQGMAKSGYTYDQILKHYYTGVEIKKIKN